ncbi:MAG: DUF4118 domain-containing protein [Elusimicrobia bacterium]|nr:DUF4118 domain-containing protein [Elusimicrobiota bacterium]
MLAFAVAWLAFPNIKKVSFIFMTAVSASAWYGGLGPAMASMVLSLLAIFYRFTPPAGDLRVPLHDIDRLGLFIILSIVMGLWGNKRRLGREELEAQVRERTVQLTALNKELEKARDQALESNRVKSQILTNVSHELRTPLNGIVGLAQLLLDSSFTKDQRDFLHTILSSAGSLQSVVENLLDLSHLEAGRMTLGRRDFNLPRLFEEISEQARPKAEAKRIGWHFQRAPDAPEVVNGDPERLARVVRILVDNAVKFTQRGEVILQTGKLLESKSTVEIRVAVADTGEGIPLEAGQHLFKPFIQADPSLTRRHGGAGLGLAIAKSLVDLMGGRIGFESEPGRGSTFWVEIPLAKTPVDAPRMRSFISPEI